MEAGYLYTNIFPPNHDELTVDELSVIVQTNLNNKIDRATLCSEFLDGLANGQNPLTELYKLRSTIQDQFSSEHWQITRNNIENNVYPFIVDGMFNFTILPTWIGEDLQKWKDYYRNCRNRIVNDEIINVLNSLDYLRAVERKISVVENNRVALLKFGFEKKRQLLITLKRDALSKNNLIRKSVVIVNIGFIAYLSIIGGFVSISQSVLADVSIGIFGAMISILGFIVLYIGIAFENVRRTYGDYASKIFFALPEIKWFLVTTFITIVSALLASIISQAQPKAGYFLFNLSTLNFLVTIITVYPYSRIIIENSNSPDGLEYLIRNIDVNDVTGYDLNKKPELDFKKVNKSFASNRLYILRDIVAHNLNHSNYRLVSIILRELEYRLLIILINSNPNQVQFREILQPLEDISNHVIKKSLSENFEGLSEGILEARRNLNLVLACKHYPHQATEEFFKSLTELVRLFREYKKGKLVTIALQNYAYCLHDQIKYNCHHIADYRYLYNSNFSDSVRKNWETLNDLAAYDYSRLTKPILINDNYSDNTFVYSTLNMMADTFEQSGLSQFQIRTATGMIYYQMENLFSIWLDKSNAYSYVHLPISSYKALHQLNLDTEYSNLALMCYLSIVLMFAEKNRTNDYNTLSEIGNLCRNLAFEIFKRKEASPKYEIALISTFQTLEKVFVVIVPKMDDKLSEVVKGLLQSIDTTVTHLNSSKDKDLKMISEISNSIHKIAQLCLLSEIYFNEL